MTFNIMTIFPAEVDAFLSSSIIGRARKKGVIEVNCFDIRDYTLDKHNRVDDYAYGGGQGMLMQAEPICRCFDAIKEKYPMTHTVYMSPKGKKLTQTLAKRLLKYDSLTILCGHYEGVDQRAIDLIADEEISVGDYVLTGGELPAMILTDTVARMVKGVLSDDVCFEDESIYGGLLEYPQYTRPPVYRGLEVPEVLKSGNTAKIEDWKLKQSLNITREQRKDLYSKYIGKKTRTMKYLNKSMSEKMLGKVYGLMQKSFPRDEIRTFADQKRLFSLPCFDMAVLENFTDIIGFISVWDLDGFNYVEHLAVAQKHRGLGYGSKIIKDYMKEHPAERYVLEVEPPRDEISKKRVAFYERLGFTFNDFEYIQPALSGKEVELRIMATGGALSEEEFENIKKMLYGIVYKKAVD